MSKSSTARVKAWREALQRKATLFDKVDTDRRALLAIEATFCVGDPGEIAAVLSALSDDPVCFRFPRRIDGMGCLWRGPAPSGRDTALAEAALEAHRAKTAQQVPAPAETVETANAAAV